jgi:hypothetical protein
MGWGVSARKRAPIDNLGAKQTEAAWVVSDEYLDFDAKMLIWIG